MSQSDAALSLDYERWGGGKTQWGSVDQFAAAAATGLSSGLHGIAAEGLPLDVLAVNAELLHKGKQKVLPVFFSAAVGSRAGKAGPFFSGSGMASAGGYAALCISDPSLALSSTLSLAWYAGSARQRTQVVVEHLLRATAQALQTELLLIGGSGAGFAALHFGANLGKLASVVAWNPQTDLLAYYRSAVRAYLQTCFPDMSWTDDGNFRAAPDRLAAAGIEHQLAGRYRRGALPRRTIYLQNGADRFHIERHAGPLLARMGVRRLSERAYADDEERFIACFLEWGEGHASLPKPELAWLIGRMMNPLASVATVHREIEARAAFAGRTPGMVPLDFRELGSKLHFSVAGEVREGELRVFGSVAGIPSYAAHPRYAFYVFAGERRIRTQWYGPSIDCTFELDPGEGPTKIVGFAIDCFGSKISATASV